MKLNRALLVDEKPFPIDEEIDFSSFTFKDLNVKKIDKCHISGTATQYDDLLRISFKIDVDLTGICAYTLEDVPLHYLIEDELDFTDSIEDDDSLIYNKDIVLDFDEFILGIILAKVPKRVIKKGAVLPKSGNGYRVLSEEDFLKERAKEDNPFAGIDIENPPD